MEPETDDEDEVDTGAGRFAEQFPTERSGLVIVIGTAAAYVVGSIVLTRAFAAVDLSIDAAIGLVIGLGFVFGSSVAFGAGLGSVLAAVLVGTFGVHTAFSYAATFLLVYLAVVFWNTLGRYETFDDVPGLLPRFVLAVLPATVTAAVINAWGGEILGRTPFTIAFRGTLVGGLLGAFTIGLLVLLAGRWSADELSVGPPTETIVFSNRWPLLVAAVVPLLWGVTGFTLSVALQPMQLEYAQIIANRFGWPAVRFVNLVGPAGRNLQILLGTCGLILIGVAIFAGTRHTRED